MRLSLRTTRLHHTRCSSLLFAGFTVALAGALTVWALPKAGAQSLSTTVRADELLSRRDAPAAVSVVEVGLPGQANAPSAYRQSVAELLVGQPGVQIRRSGGLGQWSGASLRGAAPGQVAVFLDGVPLSRGSQSAVDLSQLPLDGLERVEIYRGVPPLALGSEAIGGAINLITRHGQGPKSTWLSLGSGAFGLKRLSVGFKAPRPKLMISLGYQSADGNFPYYFNEGLRYRHDELPQLQRRNDDFAQINADLRMQAEVSHGSLFIHSSGVLRRQGVAGIGQPSSLPGEPRLHTGRALLDGGARLHHPSRRISIELDGHVLLEGSQHRDLVALPTVLTEQLTTQMGARTLLRVTPGVISESVTSHLLTVAEVRYERQQQRDLCPAPRRDCERAHAAQSERLRGAFAVGGELYLADRRLLFEPGLHLLVARSQLAGLGDRDLESVPASLDALPSPRAAARVLLLPWLLLRMSCGRFVRLPSFLELFGDGAFFRKSLGLRPESAWTGEVGIEARGQPFSRLTTVVSLHAFGRTIDDLIDVVRDGPTLRARNVGQASTAGLELASSARLGELLHLDLNYSFLDSRDRTDQPGRTDKLLPGRPQHSVFLRGTASYRPAQLFYELDHVSEVFLDPANLVLRPPRTLHAVGLALGPLGPLRLSLRVEIRNLLDTRLVDVTLPLATQPVPVPLTDFFDYPLPGRALYATLSGRL